MATIKQQAKSKTNQAAVVVGGILAALPLFLTVFIIGWLLTFINGFLGPSSPFGKFLVSLGLGVSTSASYLLGLGLILGAIYLLGILVESRLGTWIATFFESIIRRMPLISNIYDLSSRVVSVIGTKDGDNTIKNMSPAWCFFGGKPGAAVLALLPTTKPIQLDGEEYLGVVIPSAPVPFGGALIYVPTSWIEPAHGYVDDLVSVYVSMGITPPRTNDAPTPQSV